jgi:hypothetical protein
MLGIDLTKRGGLTVPAVQKKLLIHKLYQIGKSLLTSQKDGVAPQSSSAIDWLRHAFKLVDQLDEGTAPDTRELRVCSESLDYYVRIHLYSRYHY